MPSSTGRVRRFPSDEGALGATSGTPSHRTKAFESALFATGTFYNEKPSCCNFDVSRHQDFIYDPFLGCRELLYCSFYLEDADKLSSTTTRRWSQPRGGGACLRCCPTRSPRGNPSGSSTWANDWHRGKLHPTALTSPQRTHERPDASAERVATSGQKKRPRPPHSEKTTMRSSEQLSAELARYSADQLRSQLADATVRKGDREWRRAPRSTTRSAPTTEAKCSLL